MGQLALGLRSLLIRLVVFFVMAALLAWALGGTLWPRAEVVRLESVPFDGQQWFWEMSVGGRHPGEVRWRLMVLDPEGEGRSVDERLWCQVAGPVVSEGGLYYAALGCSGDRSWRIERISGEGPPEVLEVPDRLAVERQLARLRAGLGLQSPEMIQRQRSLVLEPPGLPPDR
jgi:hypothetical protein